MTSRARRRAGARASAPCCATATALSRPSTSGSRRARSSNRARPRPDREPGARLHRRRRRGDASSGRGHGPLRRRSLPGEHDRDAPRRRRDEREPADRGAAAPGRPSGAAPSRSGPGSAEAAGEAVLLPGVDGGAAARARRRRGRLTPTCPPSASITSSERPQLGQNRAPIRIGAPHVQIVFCRRRSPRAPDERRRSRDTRVSIATSSAHRSTTSVSLNWSRRYISSVSPPRSRSRSSRSSSSARRSRRSSLAAGAGGLRWKSAIGAEDRRAFRAARRPRLRCRTPATTHVLDVDVLVDAEGAALAPVARLLDAAERHLVGADDAGVGADAAELEPLRDARAAARSRGCGSTPRARRRCRWRGRSPRPPCRTACSRADGAERLLAGDEHVRR